MTRAEALRTLNRYSISRRRHMNDQPYDLATGFVVRPNGFNVSLATMTRADHTPVEDIALFVKAVAFLCTMPAPAKRTRKKRSRK